MKMPKNELVTSRYNVKTKRKTWQRASKYSKHYYLFERKNVCL